MTCHSVHFFKASLESANLGILSKGNFKWWIPFIYSSHKWSWTKTLCFSYILFQVSFCSCEYFGAIILDPIVPSTEGLGTTGYEDFALYSTSIDKAPSGMGMEWFLRLGRNSEFIYMPIKKRVLFFCTSLNQSELIQKHLIIVSQKLSKDITYFYGSALYLS